MHFSVVELIAPEFSCGNHHPGSDLHRRNMETILINRFSTVFHEVFHLFHFVSASSSIVFDICRGLFDSGSQHINTKDCHHYSEDLE